MEIDEAITTRANDDSELAAIFGTNIHWDQRPQGQALPALVFQQISEQRPQDLDGFEDMRTARIQADSLAFDGSVARQGIEATIAALIGEAEVGDIVFWRAAVDGPRSDGDDSGNGFIYRASADLIIRYAKIA